MRYVIMAATLVLAGCATPQERAERAIARHSPYCEKLGFEKGTDGWRNCIMSEEQARNSAAAASSSNTYRTQPRRTVTCQTIGTITTCN